jgi:hypothetical protein
MTRLEPACVVDNLRALPTTLLCATILSTIAPEPKHLTGNRRAPAALTPVKPDEVPTAS